MAEVPAKTDFPDHATLVKLAREIAIEHFPIERILQNLNISPDMWETRIKVDINFLNLLDSAVSEWQSALNTHERTKLKAAAMMEEWMPKANEHLFGDKDTLTAKIELAKLIARLGGMGLTGVGIEGGASEKLSVTINIGESKLRFEKDITPKVIEHEATKKDE